VIEHEQQQRPRSAISYIARRAARHYGLFLVVLGLGLVATAAVVRYTDQVYRSETVILYRNSRAGSSDSSDSSRRVASRLQDMLMSRERIGRVIKELSLYPEVKNRDEAADQMHKKIGFRARDGNTFLVTFDAPSPAVAQAAVGRLATTLIEDNTRLRVQEARETGRFLDQERRRLGTEVKSKEAALTAFLRAHPDALGRTESSGPPPGLDELQREMDRLRGTPSSDGQPSQDVIASLRRAEADFELAQKDMAEKSQRLTNEHPDMIITRHKITQAEETLKRIREGAGLTRPAGEKADGKGAQLTALEQEMARLRRRGSGGSRPTRQQLEVSVMFESLRHDLEQARGRLAGLEDKQFQAGLAANLETNSEIGQLAILDPASRPGLPVVDVRKKVGIAGIALALMLALGAAVLRGRSDDRIHTRDDVEWLGGKPVLVLLPAPPKARGGAHG
jgi:polysaccharide biosynthesis transport protein